MKSKPSFLRALAAASLLWCATAAHATDMAEGEVRKLDLATGKVTLKHGPIKSLDMPPMTMVFTAADKALLTPFKVGDKVRFVAVHEAGKYKVTALQPAP